MRIHGRHYHVECPERGALETLIDLVFVLRINVLPRVWAASERISHVRQRSVRRKNVGNIPLEATSIFEKIKKKKSSEMISVRIFRRTIDAIHSL